MSAAGSEREPANLAALLPHRSPMRLLDSADMADGQTLVSRQRIPVSDPVLHGHFPGLPIWPGALLIEAMAQTTAIWLIHHRGALLADEVPLLGAVDCTFRRPVHPGASVRFETRCLRQRNGLGLFAVSAALDSGELVARARISAAIKPKAAIAPAAG